MVNGRGAERLRAAGIRVDHAGAVAQEMSRELNIGFFSRMQRGRPWMRMKIAASLDGRTALESGESQWITGEAARLDGHGWRKRASALLTGSGTVLADDPRLDVRGHAIARQPLRIVLDSSLATPANARLFEAQGPVLIVTARSDVRREDALRQRGAEIIHLPAPNGQVDLNALMDDLARRELNELHVEAGARLNAALLRAGWVDELLIYQAPLLLGPGRGMAALPALAALAGAQRFAYHRMDRLGDDLRLMLRQVPQAPNA
jgi:diaminohydroxyphosphoribosylaminopyrimidine deaminase/5-amino-6-(5-phosphoribosylamino)uracil reductase